MKHLSTKRFSLLLALSLFSVVTFAESDKNYKSTAVAKVATTGAGTVYVEAKSGGTSGSWGTTSTATYTQKTSSAPTHKYSYQYKTNAGYTWQGWYDKETGGTQQSTANSYEVSVSATEGGNTTTLFARWTANKYYVAFKGNGSTGGSMSNQEFTYNEAKKALSANSYERKYKVTYAPNEGTCDKSDETAAYAFAGWSKSPTGTKEYDDKELVQNLATSGTVELYAVWTPKAISLATATRDDYKFLGWFDGENKIGDAGASYTPTADITLTAQWQPVASVTVAPVAIAELVYTGEDQTLISAGEAVNGTLQYSLDGENYSTELPQGKDAKAYTVYFKVEPVEGGIGVDATSIKATIAKADASVKTAPVAYDTLAYNGLDQELIIVGEAAGGEMQYSLDGETYATTIPTAKEIGEYTVYYKVVGDANHNDVAAATVAVSIAKPRAELTTAPVAIDELVYDGVAHTLITAGEAAGGELQYSLDGENYATTLPEGTNAQTYTVYYKVVGDENHSDLVCNPLEVTIAKVALTIAAENKETTYGVEAPAFTVTYQGFIGEETEAVLDGELAFDCEYAVGSNAGEYVITPKGQTAQNYNITFNEGKLTVAKAALSVTAEDKETTYGAEAPAFTVAYEGFYGEETEAVLTGELAFACEYAVGSNAGEYTITPSGLEAVNYEITFNEGKLTVAKAALSVTAENKQTTYGAEAPAFTVAYEGFIGEETEAVLEGEIAFACEYEVGNNAGEYTITPSGLTAGNYEITFNEGTLTVAKVDVEIVVAPAAKAGLVYTGEPQELITAGEVTGGELQYSLKANKDFSTDIPTRTEIGFYQVYYRVVADANHNDVAATMIMTRIAGAKASLTVEPVAAENLVYTGEAQALLATAGEAEGGELQYSLDGENYTAAQPVATNAGDYTVYYKVVGDGTHSDLEPATLNVSIAKADAAVAVAPEAIENLVANGDDHELVTAGEAIGGTIVYSLDGENFSAELPVASEEGDYTVTYKVQGDENHNDSEAAELTVTIAEQGTATAVDNSRSQVTVKKVIRDNQVLIIREGRTYNAAGLLVK